MAHRAGIPPDAPLPVLASGIDFVLEGLYSQKKIGRSDDRGYHGADASRRPAQSAAPTRTPVLTPDDEEEDGGGGGRRKKRYYN
jgi:hypothetical protein